MKKFIVLYHAPKDAMEQTSALSPEEQAEGMALWMKWAKKCGGYLVDLGSPLVNGQRLSPENKSTPSEKQVAGYSILQADNMEDAVKLLQDHPHLGWNAACSIEVHEAMPLPGT